MSSAGSPRSSSKDTSSPRDAIGGRNLARTTNRDSASPETGGSARKATLPLVESAPLWVSLPAVQDLFISAIPQSSASQSISMISWLKFWSERSNCIPALANLSKTDFITIFLDTKRGAVGSDAHELSLADFCSCLIAVADRLNMVSITSSPGRSAATCAPSSEVLSVMARLTSSLMQGNESKQSPLAPTPHHALPPAAVVAVPSRNLSSSIGIADINSGIAAPLDSPAFNCGAPDISSQVLQLLHRFYEFYSHGSARLSHDNYVQCLVELQALQAASAASGDATQIFFKFAATPDRGMTREQFVDSFVHLAHESAPESPLHSSLHALVILGMGPHFSRSQERHQLQEVLHSDIIGGLLKETQSFCEAAFRTCSGGKSILNIAQANRWIISAKISPAPSQTDIIRVFRDVLRVQAARGSSSVGLDSLGFQQFLLQLAILPVQAAQLNASAARSAFLSLLNTVGWGAPHVSADAPMSNASPVSSKPPAPISTNSPGEFHAIVASPASVPTSLAASSFLQDGHGTMHGDDFVDSHCAPSFSNSKSPPVPSGIALSLAKSAINSAAASVGNDVLNQLADLDQPGAFSELQRIYTDKQVLVVQRKKELQAELDAWTAAEYEAAEVKYKEQAVFRPTPALQDRERALQVLLSNATKTHPDELRRQQQIVEAFASKERQAWRFRCDVYSSTVRSRVKMAVDVKKNRLADTLKSMQIQLEVNMKKDFEALSRRFAGKAAFLRSSGPVLHASERVSVQPASATPRVTGMSSKPSVATRSQSAPRKRTSSTDSNREFGGQEELHKHGDGDGNSKGDGNGNSNGVLRERPQSSIPTMSRRKSVLQEMEEAYLKAASRAEPRKAPLPTEARGRQAFSTTPRPTGRRSASAVSDSRLREKAAAWGGSSSNTSNGQSRLNQTSDDDEAPTVEHAEQGRQERLRARMQSRSSRAKPWLAKSPSASTPPASSNRVASSDRSQLAADILNEDRVALAARLRDPGDDPPPYYSRDPAAADDEPLNVSRQALGVKPNSRDYNADAGQVIGVSEPEEWREISTLQTEWLGACIKISRFLISMQS